jgi:hypothetical protein
VGPGNSIFTLGDYNLLFRVRCPNNLNGISQTNLVDNTKIIHRPGWFKFSRLRFDISLAGIVINT